MSANSTTEPGSGEGLGRWDSFVFAEFARA